MKRKGNLWQNIINYDNLALAHKNASLGKKHYYQVRIVNNDLKAHLHSVFVIVKKYLKNHLDLDIKENHQIFPTQTRGVDFVGYRFFGKFTLLRKSIAKNIKAKMKILRKRDKLGKPPLARHINSFYSYLGFLKHCNSRRFFKKNMRYLDYKLRRFLGKKPTLFKENKKKCNF